MSAEASSEVAIDGFVKPGFEGVRRQFEKNFSSRHELGAAVSVVRGNEVLVDLWGGWTDQSQQTPWEADTLVHLWSTSKGFVATAANMLVDRGELALDDPVANYWPEFAQAGKDQITVRQLLSHQAGLAAWNQPVESSELHNWALLCDRLAAQPPWWEPGTASGYHALTFGHLVGELVRRVDGRPIEKFISEEITQPLGERSISGDFYLGTSPEHDARTAEVQLIPLHILEQAADSSASPQHPLAEAAAEARDASGASEDAVDVAAAELPSDFLITALASPSVSTTLANSTEWRRGVFPAANGHGSARGVAAMYGVMANRGELDGWQLLSAAAIDNLREVQISGRDLVLQEVYPMDWGLGYMLNGQGWHGPNKSAFHHGGYGGSLGFADPEANFGFGYAMNAMNTSSLKPDMRAIALLHAVHKALAD